MILVTGGSGFIGTNLIDRLVALNRDIINVDTKPPQKALQRIFWKECDILNSAKLQEIFSEFCPDSVIHLAARTDVEGKSIEDYKPNTLGTQNILDAIKSAASVGKAIITSTQFVHQSKNFPQHDEDFVPFTIYGQSKVIAEKLTRKADLKCSWTIIRPTNIWGPWHPRYPYEFWKVLSRGRYVHPGKTKVMRSYGYVGNVIWQIMRILEADKTEVSGKVLYVGDRPIDLYDWVNGFSLQQRGKNVFVVPRALVRALALTGDLLKIARVPFPITSSRYRSMTTSNPAPMEKTFQILGEPPYTLEGGITETVAWMRESHPELIRTMP